MMNNNNYVNRLVLCFAQGVEPGAGTFHHWNLDDRNITFHDSYNFLIIIV